MSDSFANIGRICITQTCKLIYDIGHQGPIKGVFKSYLSCAYVEPCIWRNDRLVNVPHCFLALILLPQ